MKSAAKFDPISFKDLVLNKTFSKDGKKFKVTCYRWVMKAIYSSVTVASAATTQYDNNVLFKRK